MAHSTTSSTTHQIVKYSSSKTPSSAQVAANDVPWKHHQGEHLRLTLDITTSQTSTPPGTTGQPHIRYGLKISYLSDLPDETQAGSQSAISEVVLESLDLSSFSGLKYYGRELPLKAVHKNKTVAFRYLHPQVQDSTSPQLYRRFQVTFNTEAAASSFIDSIQLVCPFSAARDPRPQESQASQAISSAPRPQVPASGLERSSTTAQTQRTVPSTSGPTSSLRFSSTLPRSATTYRKNNMFDDPLSTSSLGEHASSQSSGTSTTRSPLDAAAATSGVLSRPSVAQRVKVHPVINLISSSPSSDRDVEMHSPSPARSAGPALGDTSNNYSPVSSPLARVQLPSQSTEVQANVASRENQAGGPVQGDMTGPERGRRLDITSTAIQVGDLPGGQAGGISDGLLSALRQGDSDIYDMSFSDLRQLVAEVIREPKFPELVAKVHNMWKEKAIVDLNIASTNQ